LRNWWTGFRLSVLGSTEEDFHGVAGEDGEHAGVGLRDAPRQLKLVHGGAEGEVIVRTAQFDTILNEPPVIITQMRVNTCLP